MAANNYFNFTHGGTQYGTTPTGAYNQYAVAPASSAPTGYNTSRPAYDQQAYHAAAAASQGTYGNNATPTPTYDYGYGRPTQSYDKAYYQQAQGYSGGAPPSTYDGSAAPGKLPGYQAPTTYAQPRSAMPTPAKVYNAPGQPQQQQQQYVTQTNYSQPAAASSAATVPKAATTNAAPTTYSNYDAALYNATTMYAAQQGKPQGAGGPAGAGHPYKKTGMGGGVGASNAPGASNNGGKMRYQKPSQAKPQQLHYCEVCKISCAGPQTYREHLDGQKHKKRQAGLKLVSIGGAGSTGSRGSTMHCQLCDVACTGVDAYAAHVRGSKHQKVVKLHQKLGKPIPQQDAVPAAVKKPSKINFVSESKPSMTVDGSAAVVVPGAAPGPTVPPTATIAAPIVEATTTSIAAEEDSQFAVQVDIKPVGQEYIEEIRDDAGKVISFNCKLCDCKFNDPNAKEMHMKGRRHRLQYKKKVQPDLVVDLKPSPRRLKIAEAKTLRNRRFQDEGMIMEDDDRRYWDRQRREEEMNYYVAWVNRGYAPEMGRPCPIGIPGGERRLESSDDRHVVARHAEIYPKEEELQVIQRIVSHTERALKFVSDALAGGPEKKAPDEAHNQTQNAENADQATANGTAAKLVKEDGRDNQMFSFQKDADGIVRVLKGVMRVGLLAKGLLLQGDTLVQLVVLCAEKPTQGLLRRVATELPLQLANISKEHSYTVSVDKEEGAVVVTDGQITVKVSLTSPLLREQNQHDSAASTAVATVAAAATTNEMTPAATEQATAVGSADEQLLPREPCLAALAALRHAKWFQARATSIQSCVMVMRVFRDLCQRTPTWNAIPQWAMELLIEKVITSAGMPLSPGDCMRRVLEAVSSGLLIHGPGILDPCEKEPTDALAPLSKQQREDITVSGQHFLRCIAFRRIFDVLGIKMLRFPLRVGASTRFVRKRRHSGTNNTDTEGDNGTEVGEKIMRTEEPVAGEPLATAAEAAPGN